jgi:hypothetical protein
MVNGQPVDVTIDAPEGVSIMYLQELAEKCLALGQQDDHHRSVDGECQGVPALADAAIC